MVKFVGENQREFVPYTFEELQQKKAKNQSVVGKVIKLTANDLLLVELGEDLIGELSISNFSDMPHKVSKVALIDKVGKLIETQIDHIYSDKIILNRAMLQKNYKEQTLNKVITPGFIFTADIVSISHFGVFIDMGCGVLALLPNEYIAMSRGIDAREIFQVGEEIPVIYKYETNGQYVVSHKELLGTWSENIKDFNFGDVVPGIVHEKNEHGLFITLAPNLTGIADLPDYDINIGDVVTVKVKNIIPEKMKVKLSVVSKVEKEYKLSIKYRIKEGKIREWVYSPKEYDKVVSTTFF